MKQLWVTKFAIYQKDKPISFSNGFCVASTFQEAENQSFDAISKDYKGSQIDILETSPVPRNLIESAYKG